MAVPSITLGNYPYCGMGGIISAVRVRLGRSICEIFIGGCLCFGAQAFVQALNAGFTLNCAACGGVVNVHVFPTSMAYSSFGLGSWQGNRADSALSGEVRLPCLEIPQNMVEMNPNWRSFQGQKRQGQSDALQRWTPRTLGTYGSDKLLAFRSFYAAGLLASYCPILFEFEEENSTHQGVVTEIVSIQTVFPGSRWRIYHEAHEIYANSEKPDKKNYESKFGVQKAKTAFTTKSRTDRCSI